MPAALQLDDDEKKELYALRLENDTLRQNLGRLEEKVHSAEEQHATGRSTGVDGRAAEKDAPKELRQLHEILTWLHAAKTELVENDRSKLELQSDVRLLYGLLERAKTERRCYDRTISRLERCIQEANATISKVEKTNGLQRRSFKRILRSDRDYYENRTEAAEALAESRRQKLKNVLLWVDRAESKYADALRRMTTQAEELGAANLGDLEGYAQDMSSEAHQLRESMAEVMQPLNSKCRDGTKDGGASKETAASKAKRKRKANNGPALKSAVVDKSDVKEAVVKSDVAVGATGDARDKKTAEGIS